MTDKKRKNPLGAVAEKAAAVARAAADKVEEVAMPTAAGRAASAAAASGKNTTVQSYQSPRNYGEHTDALAAQTENARKAMEERGTAVMQRQKALETAYTEMCRRRETYWQNRDSFTGSRAEEYRQRLLGWWNESMDTYEATKAECEKLWAEYQPYEDTYNRMAQWYNDYVSTEQAEYDAWRGSIRDADTIRQELTQVQNLRNELRQRMRGGADVDDPYANEQRIAELQGYLGAVGDRERLLEEELGYSEYFYWEDLRQNADFAQGSQYQAERFQNPKDDFQYNYINTKGSNDPDDPMYRSDHNYGKFRYMNRDEITMYNYLYSTRGAEGAREYLDYLEPELNRRVNGEEMETLRNWAGEHPFLSSTVSVMMSPMSGVTSLAGTAAEKLTGEEIDPNSRWFTLSNQKNAIRDEVGGNIEESLGEFWGPVGSFGYQLAMSAGDMLMDAASGNSVTATGLLLTRSFSESVIDGKNRGLSDREAMELGVVSAAAEWITERIGLDELMRLPKGWTDQGFWKNAFRGMIGEAGEEGLTNIINFAADNQIAGDKSQFAQNIARHKADGKSDEDALKLALKEAGLSLLLDTLGGGITGAAFGGVDGLRSRGAANAQQTKENAAPGAANEEETAQTDREYENADEEDDDYWDGLDPEDEEDGVAQEQQEQPSESDSQQAQEEAEDPEDPEAGVPVISMEEAQHYLPNESRPNRFLPQGEETEAARESAPAAQTQPQEPQFKTPDEAYDTMMARLRTSPDGTHSQGGYVFEVNYNSGSRGFIAEIREEASGKTLWKNGFDRREDAYRHLNTEARILELFDGKKPAPQKSAAAAPAPAKEEGTSPTNADESKPDAIKRIVKTGNEMELELEDGRIVTSDEVLYASEGEAMVYEAVASLAAPANISNILVDNYKSGAESVDAEDYALGVALAYNHGKHNLPKDQMTSNPYIAKLTEVQRNSAYELGQRFGKKQAETEEITARRTKFARRFQEAGRPLTGRVHYDGDVRTLNARQRASVAALEKVADALGVQIHLFESQADENGIQHGENGWYDTRTGDIHIDIHAGISGEDTMLFTAAHELTHFIRQWSPAKFKVLADFLMEQYGKKGVNVHELVELQQAKAMRSGREMSFDDAFEEMVADSMESMLADGSIVEQLAKLGQQDRSLLKKLCDGIRDLTAKIRKVYEGLKPDSREGRYVAEMKDTIERMQELFTEALEAAGKNYRAANQAEAETAAEDVGEYDWSDFDEDDVEFSRRGNEKTARMGRVNLNIRSVNGEQVVWIEGNILNENKGQPVHQFIANYIAKHIGEVYTIIESGQKVYIGEDLPGEYTQSEYTKAILKKNSNVIKAKNKAAANLGEMIEIATHRRWEPTKHPGSKDAKYGMYRYDTRFGFPVKDHKGNSVRANIYTAELLIRNASDGKKYLYDIVKIKKDTASSDWLSKRMASAAANAAGQKGDVSTDTVAQERQKVNTKFSMRQPVEETKTLIAMHNLTEDKLAKAVELGGFPMPSIAVTKADIPHTNFGEISLIMDKDTVDPKTDRRNDVFSADAWTPTFPRTEYEANSEVEDRVRRTLQGLEKKIAPQFQGNLRRVMYGLEDLLNSYDGEENLIDHVLENDGMKAVYLESQGKHIAEVQKEQEIPKRFSQAAKDKCEAIIAALGTRDPAEIGTMPLKDIRDNYGAELEKIVPGISRTSLRLSRFMQQTIDYLMDDGSGPETEMVTDQAATRQALEDALDREGYEAWVRELFSGIEGDKGIHNGKDRFTPSGRSRSFQQTHLPVTLDNIVKAMAAQNNGNIKNVSGFNGIKTLRAGTAQRFKSIEGMHKLEGRLQNLTEEQLTAMTDALNSRLYDLIDKIDQEAGRKGTSNNLIRFDQIGQIITEASETGRYNVADIQKVFRENHQEISDELAMKVKELLFDVSQMPVNLFEAKPRRAVRFDEVRAAVVPADTSEKLKRKLAEQGVPVIEYERDDVDDRLRKVNSVEGVKFSDRDPAAQKLNQALQKQNAAQAEEIKYLRELVKLQGKVTNGTKFTQSSVRRVAKELMQTAGAKGNYLELAEILNGVYERIASEKKSQEPREEQIGFDEYITARDTPSDMSWSEVESWSDEAAQWLMEHIEVKPDRGEYANDILRDLRTRRISLNVGQMAEVKSRYGSYNDFRKAMFGSFTLSRDGTPLDMLWQELASEYPGTFDANIGDADMALELADVVERLRETNVAAMEFEMQRDSLQEELRQKVYDGYWRVSTLHTVADKYQKKIDDLKQRHRGTMEQLDRAGAERDAANADIIDSTKKIRRRQDEAVKKVREQYQESKKKSVEGRKKTAMRHKIQRVVKELNDLLLKPDKKRHVPEGLRKVVAEALDVVNMDNLDADTRIEAINDELAELYTKRVIATKAGDVKDAARLLGKIRQLEQRRAKIEAAGDRLDEKLKALHAAYEEIKNSDDPDIANAYNEGLSSYILVKASEIGDTPLKNMNMEQLGHVYDLYQMVLTTIRNSNKLFSQALADGAAASAETAVKEFRANGRRSRLGIKLVEEVRKFGVNNLKPIYFFSYLNSGVFLKLYQGLREGMGQYGRDMAEGREFCLEQRRKFGFKNWDFKKTWTFHSSSGERFKLNLEQIMSLYAFSKRDQARDHIREGGVVIDKETDITEVVEADVGFNVKVKLKLTGKVRDATAYPIDDVTLDEIIGKLTKKQREYVDAMQEYLSDTMAAKGNEVSMALYNIKLFKDKHYFPLRSAQEYSVRAREQADQTARLKNAGFTKGTVPHARNPIVLSQFSDVWAGHVQDMSSYHAMTLPLEDLYRVYNYGRKSKGGSGDESVVATIQNAFGPQATGYIDQLLKDLNGGQTMDSAGSIPEAMMSRFKKGAVFMSASVLFQQSSSVARALAEIDARYISPMAYVESLTVIPRQLGGAFVKGAQKAGMVDKNWASRHDKVWAEVKQYAPIAIIKEMGYFDMNMGKTGRDFLNAEEYTGFWEKLKGAAMDSSYRDEVLSRAPALADELAWCDLWMAVKREQQAKHKGMNINSKAFLELCGKRFTEIIDRTQVYDSVLSRSANMRSRSGIMRMATSFMGEPTTRMNMLANAVMSIRRGSVKKGCRTIGAVVASDIICAALASLAYAARDDDEDKEYLEKYLAHMVGGVWESLWPHNYVPLVQDVVSVFYGWDVERADMAIVSDLADAWNKLHSDKATDWEKTRDVLGATTQAFGLPLGNLLKDGEALYRFVVDAYDEQESTATGIGYAIRAELPEWIPGGGVVTNEDQLYEAILSGDKAHEQRVRERYKDKDGNIDEGKVTAARRKALRKNDSRIHEAAVYMNDEMFLEYKAIVEDIADEGFFDRDDVISAIESEANELADDEEQEESESKHKSALKAEHFAIGAAKGDTELMNQVKADLILTAVSNGKTEVEAEAAAVSSIRSAVKEAYVEGGAISETQAVSSLMGWCDATEKEAADLVNEWTFEKQNGYPLSELEDVFVRGEIAADEAEDFLRTRGGYARVEAESKVLQWQCEVDTGIRYDDVQQLYVDGKMTADRARELRVKYGESSLEDARKTVLHWQCEKDNDVKYTDIDVAYLSGEITEKTAISWLVKYGEKTQEEAELAVQAYRWRDEHTEYKDLGDDKIDRYIDYCEGAGISIPDFYAANKKVSEIKAAGGAQKDNVVRYIRSLPLSRSQKWAMWYAVKTTSWKDNVSF